MLRVSLTAKEFDFSDRECINSYQSNDELVSPTLSSYRATTCEKKTISRCVKGLWSYYRTYIDSLYKIEQARKHNDHNAANKYWIFFVCVVVIEKQIRRWQLHPRFELKVVKVGGLGGVLFVFEPLRWFSLKLWFRLCFQIGFVPTPSPPRISSCVHCFTPAFQAAALSPAIDFCLRPSVSPFLVRRLPFRSAVPSVLALSCSSHSTFSLPSTFHW